MGKRAMAKAQAEPAAKRGRILGKRSAAKAKPGPAAQRRAAGSGGGGGGGDAARPGADDDDARANTVNAAVYQTLKDNMHTILTHTIFEDLLMSDPIGIVGGGSQVARARTTHQKAGQQ